MDTLFGSIIVAVAGYFVLKWVLKVEVVKEEIKEVATKVEAEVKKEAEVVVAKVETAVVEEAKEAVAELTKVEEPVKVDEPVAAEVKVPTKKIGTKTKAIAAATKKKTVKVKN